ncbi:MAG TPA: SIS domain-containing protein [Anaerolineae bacterium]|nr:SIS domain-containing protein [Anaerolineae bacterium]
MAERGEHTINEILSQPLTWKDALEAYRLRKSSIEALWQRQTIDQVIFTGCGSTHYLSMTAAALFQSLTGVPSQARPASELIIFPGLVFAPKSQSMLVAISRSGETTETVEAVQVFRTRTNGPVIAITCYGDSKLASEADVALVAAAAHEKSIAQTRSFTSMTVLSEALAGHLAGHDDQQVLDQLPTWGERLLRMHQSIAQEIGEDKTLERYFFLGSGQLYGIACEAMLKMKEMSLAYSEAYHPLEFRHGPMSMVNEQTLVVGLLSDEGLQHETAVLEQMQNLGARILAISERDDLPLPVDSLNGIYLKSGLPEWVRTVLYLPTLQLMAYHRAMARGLNPDKPTNLDAVVRLEAFER